MALHAARPPARVDEAGDLVLLEDQDRACWDRRLIALGFDHFDRSMSGEGCWVGRGWGRAVWGGPARAAGGGGAGGSVGAAWGGARPRRARDTVGISCVGRPSLRGMGGGRGPGGAAGWAGAATSASGT